MAKGCTPCIGGFVKEAIVERVGTKSMSEALAEIADCKDPYAISLCSTPAGTAGGRTKRAPSAYNIHTGECMRAGNTMKVCAEKWKGKKARG